jgi:RNA polymerase sigma factor (sigma-70 family)
MLGSREWGEDALQLTFVAAYQALRRGQCDGDLRPWLYAIARNRCLSELRARREIPDRNGVSADRSAIDGPASLFARREQLREVVEDIQRLPADQRAALVLFELGDQSHEEIASVLGVRRDKVKALIFQAREGLYRGRSARESACSEVRERLATARGRASARGIVRAHIERCAPCQEFEREVRRQRAALALVLPVVLSGKLKALVLSSALSHGSVGAGVAGVTGAGGAGSLSGATVAGSGSGVVAGPGSLAAGAAASATGSASIAVGEGAVGGAGAAAGSGAVSAAVGSAAPTMVASALGTDAVTGMGVGALTSSVSVATVAKLATVVAVAVGVGGVTRSALDSSPRPQVSFLAGQPAQPAPLRSPLQPLASGIVDPLAGATQPGSQPGAGAAAPAGAPPTGAASTPGPSSNAAPSSSANPAAVSAPSTPGAGGPASPMGTTSAPAASAPGDGSATTTAPSSGNSMTTSASSPTGSGTSTSTTTTASSPTTTSAGSSSGSSASQGTSGAPSGASGNGPGDSTGQGQPSGGDPGAGATHSNGNGPPITPPGCVNKAVPGCAKKTPRS